MHENATPTSDSPCPYPSGEESSAKVSQSDRVRRYFARKRTLMFWWAFFVCLGSIFLWPYSIIAIKPGHVGVLYRRFFGGTELNAIFKEGTHPIFPWDSMFIFDTRLHEEMHSFTPLTRKGMKLELDVTVIYHPLGGKAPLLLTTVGTNYREKLVIPMLTAVVRDIAAHYDTEDFFSSKVQVLRDEMLVALVGTMGRNPIVIDNLLIRNVRLPEAVGMAIDEKLVAQQMVFKQQFLVQEAAEVYRRKFIEAQAVRMTQDIVNEKMTPEFLRWQGVEATRALADSPGSKLVIVGGRDGLPIILNPDGPLAGPPVPDASAPQATATPKETPSRAEASAVKTATPPTDEERGWLAGISQEALQDVSDRLEKSIGVPLFHKQSPVPEEAAAPGKPDDANPNPRHLRFRWNSR